MSADIEGMFLQVGVSECEHPSQHFLWREDPKTNVLVYPYNRHIFGLKTRPHALTMHGNVLHRTRVAPIKVMTDPKLKLHAALLVARMRQDACRGITL